MNHLFDSQNRNLTQIYVRVIFLLFSKSAKKQAIKYDGVIPCKQQTIVLLIYMFPVTILSFDVARKLKFIIGRLFYHIV